jgi:hypothetical protein
MKPARSRLRRDAAFGGARFPAHPQERQAALLATTDRNQRDEIRTELAAEVERLEETLLELKNDESTSLPLARIESD